MENYLGVIQDPRTDDKKALDYKHSDLAGAIVIDWKEKPVEQWKGYKPREQDGSLSCVGQGSAKAIEIMLGEVESAHPIYRSRSNYPDGGMWLGNAGDICKKIGTTTEKLDISQWQNESQMNRDITVETPVKIGGYVFVNHKNIEEVAQAIEFHKHCVLIFHANGSEWIDIPKYNGLPINFGHCVTAVDYMVYNGQKVILIEDSTGHSKSFDGKGLRIITEEYLIARCSGGMYFTPQAIVPTFKFTKTLKVGSVGYDVKMLQIKLGIGADGLFGMKTKAAVIKFQLSHSLVGDGIVGPLTNKELNK